MKNEKPNSSMTPTFCATNAPSLLGHLHVTSYPAMPVPLNDGEVPLEEYDVANINVVGVGPMGSRMVQLLSLAGITFHEIIHDAEQEASGDMAALVSSVRSSDLVFILTGFDDDYCESIAQKVGRAACEAGMLTLLVTPPAGMDQNRHQCNDGTGRWYDTMFSVSDISLSSHEEPIPVIAETAISYPMQQFVAAITNLITHRTCIGIDFNDIIKIMHEGRFGKMGIGIATGADTASIAANRAIEHLRTQGVDISTALGVLAVVHGSPELAMDDFDSASMVIHKHISPDANILIGLDEGYLGQSVQVTIMPVH
jgi:cell division protein FtsZ